LVLLKVLAQQISLLTIINEREYWSAAQFWGAGLLIPITQNGRNHIKGKAIKNVFGEGLRL